jgi:phosphonate transport system ATP-binding protein
VNLHGRRLREARRKIGTVYQQHNLVPRLKVIHNVLGGRLGQWSTVRSLLSLARPVDVESAYQALKRVGIEEKIFSRTDELSGGQQQRVAVARVLLQDPEIILSDEPVSSVDPSLASAIVKLLIEISENMRKTLLVNLHSVDLALEFFPRIVGMRNGTTLFDLSPDQITNELLEDLYSGHVPENEQDRIADEESSPPILQ